MPRPTLLHTQDAHLGWHRTLTEGPARPWMDRPILRVQAGLHGGAVRLTAHISLPSLGEFPTPVMLIDARWKPLTVTPYELLTDTSQGLQRWLEGYSQS
jgi:hypothetical protein